MFMFMFMLMLMFMLMFVFMFMSFFHKFAAIALFYHLHPALLATTHYLGPNIIWDTICAMIAGYSLQMADFV
jgi:hypothetical protein